MRPRDAELAILTAIGEGLPRFLRRLHVPVVSARALLSRGIGDRLREEAGTVEGDVWVEVLRTERVALFGERLRDVRRSQVFPHHRTILGFRQRVVVGMPRAGRGDLEAQRLQQQGHRVIDVLGAIIRMESQDDKRKALQQRPDDRQQLGLADLFAGRDQLERGHALHRVDVRHPVHPILIALMHTVDAARARPPIRLGRAALADGDAGGPRRGPVSSRALVLGPAA